jgi:hypothetical protein
MKMNKSGVMAAVVVSAVFLCGCASTHQKRSVEGSGFLKDYSQLKDRGGDTAMLSYIDPKADFRAYNKIMIDPIRAYAKDKDSSMAKLSKEKQQDLLNYFDAALREQLKTDYILVNQPGPGVLRLRIAVTEAKGSRVVLDTVSSVVPVGMVVGAAKAIVTGKNLSVGEIGAECEGVDSMTGKRLFAAVDARVGRKYTFKFNKFSKWHTAKDAMDFWAEQMKTRLSAERAADNKR